MKEEETIPPAFQEMVGQPPTGSMENDSPSTSIAGIHGSLPTAINEEYREDPGRANADGDPVGGKDSFYCNQLVPSNS